MKYDRLSIIIPCYNCQETLTEAVESVYRQNLTVPFEIVMVNDSSTDNTRKIMAILGKKHPEIKIFDHPKNLGGGAARNTAVAKSVSEVIFCLDSDDILGDGTLGKMFAFLLGKQADAIGISTSIKFNGQDLNDIAFTNNFDYVGEKIPFESLFEKDRPRCPLYSTFMFTKKAFLIAGGYPTSHGFDTQGLAWRFLANGLSAYTCPNTIYYHRINFHRSYYQKEYEEGRTNHNWFKVYEEFLYLFDEKIQKDILDFDLNDHRQTLTGFILQHERILRPDVTEFIKPAGRENYEQFLKMDPKAGPTDYYWLGSKKMTEGKATEALTYLSKALDLGLANGHVYQKLMALDYQFEEPDQAKARLGVKKLEAYQRQGRGLFLPIRIYRKLKKIISGEPRKYWLIIKERWNSSANKILFLNWVILRFRKMFLIGFNDEEDRSNPVDIVIPTVLKDHPLLEYVISALKNIRQPINKIFIISPAGQAIEDFCRRHDCVFIDEHSVLGYGKESIDYQVNGLDRSGWIFQQLLKLSGDKIVEMENYFLIDSDTILIRPHSLIEKGKFILFENEEWNEPYFKSFEKMFGYPVRNRLSFTSHMMIINVEKLRELKKELEDRNHRSWDKVYLSTIDQDEIACVSDYDTYADWLWIHYPETVIRRPLYNKTVHRDGLMPPDQLALKYGGRFRSISFHSYRQKH